MTWQERSSRVHVSGQIIAITKGVHWAKDAAVADDDLYHSIFCVPFRLYS